MHTSTFQERLPFVYFSPLLFCEAVGLRSEESLFASPCPHVTTHSPSQYHLQSLPLGMK